MPLTLAVCDDRMDDRDDGRKGVVGLDGGLRPDREFDRLELDPRGVVDSDIMRLALEVSFVDVVCLL